MFHLSLTLCLLHSDLFQILFLPQSLLYNHCYAHALAPQACRRSISYHLPFLYNIHLCDDEYLPFSLLMDRSIHRLYYNNHHYDYESHNRLSHIPALYLHHHYNCNNHLCDDEPRMYIQLLLFFVKAPDHNISIRIRQTSLPQQQILLLRQAIFEIFSSL